VKNSNGSTETATREEVSELRERLLELTARLQALEGEDQDGDGSRVSSRRDLLKLAGALAAGAAGGLVLRPLPAAAASGTAMMLGQANDANAVTSLAPSAASAPTSLFRVVGQNPPGTIPANPSTDVGATAVTVPVLVAIGPDGVFPITITSPPGQPVVTAPVYPGFAPIQGIGGPIVQGTGPGLRHVSEGIDGWAAVLSTDPAAVGAGVVGQSDNGVGVVGSAATDLAALGAGFIAQTSITDNTGATIAGPPPGGPVYPIGGEQARDKDSVLWLSNADGLTWRRVNSMIPMTPFRKYDSRPNARPANSVTTIQVGGQNGIPDDAFGVFGNLTVTGPSTDGFLTMYPAGQNVPGVNSLNFFRGVSALSNHVVVPLGTGANLGQVSIYVSGNGSTNVIFDVQGYIH